jgi:hypothetical protein
VIDMPEILIDRSVKRPGLAAVVAVLLASLIAATAGCSRGDDPEVAKVAALRSTQARRLAADAGLPDDVQRFLGRAAASTGATFTATYVAGADRLVVHQRPPRRRVDTVVGAKTASSVVLDEHGRAFRCAPPGRRWTCHADDAARSTVGAFTPDVVSRTVDALKAATGAYVTSTDTRRIAGTSATCLVSRPTSGDGAVATFCISPSGVPLLIDEGTGTPSLRALRYRPSASAADVARPDRSG